MDADGVPTSAFVDAWLQSSTQLTPLQLAYSLRRAIYLELTTIDVVEQRVTLANRHRGVRASRSALAWFHRGSAGTKSASEDRIHPCLDAQLPTPLLVNVMGAAGIPDYEPDFVWPHERIILEIDGRQHDTDPVIRERDRRRDELLRSAGWIVIRVHYRRVWNDLDGVLEEIHAAFARRI